MSPPMTTALSPAFWDSFVGDVWQRRPAVCKGVLPPDWLVEDDLLESLRRCYDGREAPGQSGFARFYADGRQIKGIEADKVLPIASDLDSYVRALSERFAAGQVAIELYDVEVRNRHVRDRLRALVAPLIERIGIPSQSVDSTMFAGDYAVTPFGIHKDPGADTLTLVIRGKKQMLVWAPEYFEEDPGRRKYIRGGADAIAACERDAVQLEAEPGDLMYWPGSAYHVARSTGGVVATCALGFWQRSRLSSFLARLVEQLVADALGSRDTVDTTWPAAKVPGELVEAARALRATVASGALEDALATAWHERAAHLGFLTRWEP